MLSQWHLKNNVLEVYPEPETIGTGESTREALELALVGARNALDLVLFKLCLEGKIIAYKVLNSLCF